jgi:hypothetical protein
MPGLSVSGVGQSASQYLQQLTGQSPASSAGSQGQSVQGKHHHHHKGGGGGGSGGQDQVSSLLNTIANALQSTDSSSDPNQVIEDTVTKLLASGGSTTANGSTSGVNAGTVAAASQAPLQQSLAQLLQAHGVSPQQFQTDLLTAVKDAQNGKLNAATALQSFPPGSALNITA